VLACHVPHAHATVITLDYDFTAVFFTPSGAPVDPVTGSFLLAFDNSSDVYSATTTGLTLTNFNIDIPSDPAFEYSASNDMARIGGLCGTVHGVCSIRENDFILDCQRQHRPKIPSFRI